MSTRKSHLIAVLLACSSMLPAQVSSPELLPDAEDTSFEMREVKNRSFKVGEKLTYTIHYGWIDAGEAVMEVQDSEYDFGDRETYRIVGKGRSLGTFDWFYKVRDHYETYLDKDGLFPHYFIRSTNEGGYKIDQKYRFYPEKKVAVDEAKDTTLTPSFVQDMISSYYYLRTLDYSEAQPGDIYEIETLVDGEVYPLKIKYVGKDTIKIRKGKFKCLKFVPVVQSGRIFKSEDDLTVWITDDFNKIPVLVKANILVGSVKMEMTDWSGLANTLSKVN